ncbi:MAG: transposase [Nanoarchaeota archaeon]|nr:transposase [Nanoarchaeota archaeon]
MAKNKLTTPAWITEGYDSKADYEKAQGILNEKKKGHRSVSSKTLNSGSKTFKVRVCPKCGSDDVGLVLSNLDLEEETTTGKQWQCKKCGWKGEEVSEKQLIEDEFMKYLDDKGEEVA